MFLTNKKKVLLEMRILQLVFILISCLLVCCYIFRFLMKKELILMAAFILVMINMIIIKKIFNLKIFEFENTGAVFSIKAYHPFNKKIISPILEYPVDRLLNIRIRRLFFTDLVIVDIDTDHKGPHLRFKIKTSNISTHFYNKMLTSINFED